MIQKITQAEIDERAVSALSDRPGAPARYGTGGLSAGALKARFDGLSLLAITKLNALIDALHGAGGSDPLIDEMTTHAVSLLDENERIPLSEWITRVETFLGLSGTGGLSERVAALEALQIPDDTPTLLKGLHPDLVAGLAVNLCGRPNDETGMRLTYRPTRDAGDVGRGRAKITSIHGSTLVWNQLIKNGDFSDAADWTGNAFGYSYISASDNVLSVSFGSGTYVNVKQTLSVPPAHKVLVSFFAKSATNNTAYTVRLTGSTNAEAGVTLSNDFKRYVVILTAPDSVSNLSFFAGATNGDKDFQLKNVFAVDLTKAFGAGKEPTAAQFRALFPLDCYACDAGRLLHFTGTGLATTGFNQWDEQWETIGQNLYNKNAVRVIPGATYYFRIGSSNFATVRAVDENNRSLGGIAYSVANGTVTIPAHVRYIGFTLNSVYGTTYKNDICIHLSWSGWRNGEYEPHRESTLALPVATYFETGMKSVGDVCDELTATAAVQRIGTRAYAAGDENDATVLTDGTTTCYVLDEPVTTAVELDLTYSADDFGTEQLLPENGAAPVTSPLTGRVLYALNAVDTVRNLPRNYVSLSTFDKLRTALAGDYTITRTYNATTSDYDVTVTRVGGVWQHDLSVKNNADEWLDLTVIAGSAAAVTYDDGTGKFTGLPDGLFAAYGEDYGAGVAAASGGVLTFYYGSSSKAWDGSGGVNDAVTRLY